MKFSGVKRETNSQVEAPGAFESYKWKLNLVRSFYSTMLTLCERILLWEVFLDRFIA